MTVHLQTRWGDQITDPSEAQMRAALEELAIDDPEHPDCWLTDESGWTLAAFTSGLVVWENVEENAPPPRHMRGVPSQTVLAMWRAISEGRFIDIESQPWQPGYP